MTTKCAYPVPVQLVGAALLALVALASGPVTGVASAHHEDQAGADGSPVSAKALRTSLGSGYTRADDGLYRIQAAPGTEPLETHGPDTSAEVASESGSPRPDGPLRSPVCAGDHAIRFLYLQRPGAEGGLARDHDELIRMIQASDAALNRESLASGGPNADYRVVCDGTGAPQIDTLVSNGTTLDEIALSAQLAGHVVPAMDYVVFADDNVNFCGIATLLPDESLSPLNLSSVLPGYAVIARHCWPTNTLMHEVGHTEGAVQTNAPHSTGSGGHCGDETDVMCYAPDGGNRNQGTHTDCSDFEHFDCGYDDYFDSAPEAGEYLSTHWNLGSPANQFIEFGHGAWQSDPGTKALVRDRRLNPELSAPVGAGNGYTFKVPRTARRLTVTLTSYPCQPGCRYEVHLFLRRGGMPTATLNKCHPAPGPVETCRIRRPKRGRWFAAVSSGGAAGGPYSIEMTYNGKR